MRRTALLLALSMLPAPALAQSHSYEDHTAALVPAGTTDLGAYPGFSSGTGDGFGRVIGGSGDVAARVGFDSDAAGNLAVGIDRMGRCLASEMSVVIYLDTRPGGFASTESFVDIEDASRAAASGRGTSRGQSVLTFPPGFEADFAIVWQEAAAGLFELVGGGSHAFVSTVSRAEDGCHERNQLSGLRMAAIGANAGDPIDYVVTLINHDNGFRSDEFHGGEVAGGNPGASPVALAADAFVRFQSVGPVLLNEVDADTPGVDMAEFVELAARPGTVLDGLRLVFFNGASNTAYNVVDVSGTTADGVWLLAPFAGADQPLRSSGGGTTGILQNGADAVGLYLAESAPSIGDAATQLGLLDAVVYDTDDADDAGLLSSLTPGQPQVNEANRDSALESNQRCGGGASNTRGYFQNPPTPGAENDCCGNGVLDAGEACDDGGDNGGTACGCQRDCTFGAETVICVPVNDGNVCDLPDRCDGMGACVPTVRADGASCGSGDPSNPCDLGDVCQAGTCVEALAPDGTLCRAADGECDADDRCVSGVCEARFAAASTECGTISGGCDVQDTCDGMGTCVEDVAAAGTICRAAASACDVAEVCDGVGGVCPDDGFVAAGTVCEAAHAGDPCDAADVCDGTGSCLERFAPEGTACGEADASLGCDEADTCDASGTCVDRVRAAGTGCRASTGACDPAEGCDGTAAACPADAFAADGTACDDELACNGAETCSSGRCEAAGALDCDDGDPCTADACAEPGGCEHTPIEGCADAGMPDGGAHDGGPHDGGPHDGGAADADGSVDGGGSDAGDGSGEVVGGCSSRPVDASRPYPMLWLLAGAVVFARRRRH